MSQLLDMLKFYTGFEINDQTGNALTENEMTTIHYDRITSLQVKCLGAWMDVVVFFFFVVLYNSSMYKLGYFPKQTP